MGRPRLYATSIERKAAWRRRQGMAVRPRSLSRSHAGGLSGAEAAAGLGVGKEQRKISDEISNLLI